MERPEYETYSCEEVGKAWQKLRKRVQKGKPLKWTGPDRLHHRIAAGSPPPSEYLTPEGREHDRDQGRSIWDTLFLIAFQIGFHNGVMSEGKDTKFYQQMADQSQEIARDANKRAKALQGIIDRCEVHMRKAFGWDEDQGSLEAMVVQAKDRAGRHLEVEGMWRAEERRAGNLHARLKSVDEILCDALTAGANGGLYDAQTMAEHIERARKRVSGLDGWVATRSVRRDG